MTTLQTIKTILAYGTAIPLVGASIGFFAFFSDPNEGNLRLFFGVEIFCLAVSVAMAIALVILSVIEYIKKKGREEL